MTPLVRYKLNARLTNKTLGQAIGKSPTIVCNILYGRHIRTIMDDEIDQLAQALGITFEQCWLAMCESYNETYGRPGMEHIRASLMQAQALQALGREPDPIRKMTTIEGSLVVPIERRIEG